jgi:hypothetical protein
MLPVSFCVGVTSWSITLSSEHGLRTFVNRVLRKIFGPKREKLSGDWRKLHEAELNDFYSSPNAIRVIR